MKLVVHELATAGNVQQVYTPTRNVNVEAVRPHIYRHNFATGNLKMQILTDGDVLLAESAVVPISGIGTLGYFHGYVRFTMTGVSGETTYLAADTPYKFKLVTTGGYTFDESAYCGWVNGYDLAKYDADPAAANNISYPMDIEIWERKSK